MLVWLFFGLAQAATAEIHVTTPGEPVVRIHIPDVAPGLERSFDLTDGSGRLSHVLSVKFEQASEQAGVWLATFDLAATTARARRRGLAPTVVTRPTMTARTNEESRFFMGRELPVANQADVFRVEGYGVSWVMRETALEGGDGVGRVGG